jgi:hypothetical protein
VRSLGLIAGAALALCVGLGAAWADTVKFTATLEPDPQATTKSNGKGTASLTLDTATKTLTGTIEYSGLSAPVAMAEFDGPPTKQNAPPIEMPIPLPLKPVSPITVKIQLTDVAIAGLKSGDWLLLLGTKQAPEIGGEVKPVQ